MYKLIELSQNELLIAGGLKKCECYLLNSETEYEVAFVRDALSSIECMAICCSEESSSEAYRFDEGEIKKCPAKKASEAVSDMLFDRLTAGAGLLGFYGDRS